MDTMSLYEIVSTFIAFDSIGKDQIPDDDEFDAWMNRVRAADERA